MNPRGGRRGGRRIRADVDARRCVPGRRADDDAGVLGNGAVLADVAVVHLDRGGAHYALLEVEVQRAAHRQLVLDHLELARRTTRLYSRRCVDPCTAYNHRRDSPRETSSRIFNSQKYLVFEVFKDRRVKRDIRFKR